MERLKTEEAKMLFLLKQKVIKVESNKDLVKGTRRVYFETMSSLFRFYDNKLFSSTLENFKQYWESLDVEIYHLKDKDHYCVIDKN